MSEVNEAIKGLDEAKQKLDSVASWVFTHSNIWDEMSAEDIKDTIETLKEDIDLLKEQIRESAQR
jgi:NTP pyrophosphatase (non-canonical NTP hydrolase)